MAEHGDARQEPREDRAHVAGHGLAELEAEVARVVVSSTFRSAPACTHVLQVLLDAARRDEHLTQRDLARELLGDSALVNRARGAIRDLRRRLDRYYAVENPSAGERLVILPGTYHLALEGVGLQVGIDPSVASSRARRLESGRATVSKGLARAAPFAVAGMAIVLASLLAYFLGRGALGDVEPDDHGPASVEFHGAELRVHDALGRSIWSAPLPALADGWLTWSVERHAVIVDLDGDRTREVIVVTPAEDRVVTQEVVVYSATGHELLRWSAGSLLRSAPDGGRLVASAVWAWPRAVGAPGTPQLLLAGTTHDGGSTRVAVLDAAGTRLGHVDHPGTLSHFVAWDDAAGGPSLAVLAGTEQGFDGCVLILFDPERMEAGAVTRVRIPSALPPGPDSCVPERNVLDAMGVSSGWVRLSLRLDGAGLRYYLDRELRPTFPTTDDFVHRFHELEAMGLVRGPIESFVERVEAGVTVGGPG